MGCGTVNRPKSVIDSTPLKERLISARETLVSEIIRVHNISLKCKQEIENCVLADNRKTGFLLKQKQIIIRLLIKGAQQLVAALDLNISNLTTYPTLLLKANTLALEGLRLEIGNQDIEDILKARESQIKKHRKLCAKYNLSNEKVQKEIDEDFHIISNNSIHGNYRRKKFLRRSPHKSFEDENSKE